MKIRLGGPSVLCPLLPLTLLSLVMMIIGLPVSLPARAETSGTPTAHPAASAGKIEETPEQIIDRMDALYRSVSSTATVEMEVRTPDWKRNMKFRIVTSGMDRTFIEILEPAKDKGIRTLRIEREMWNYFPKINKVMKVPPSMMMGSWMGSDFTNDDLVREVSLKRDYVIARLPDQPGQDHIRLSLKSRPGVPTVWAEIIVTIARATGLPAEEEFFDETGKLMRRMSFSDVRAIGGRTIPTAMTLKPVKKDDYSTTVRYLDVLFDQPVPEEVFSLRHLQSR